MGKKYETTYMQTIFKILYKWYGLLHQYMHQHVCGKLKYIPLCPLDKLFMIKLLNTLTEVVALTVDFH